MYLTENLNSFTEYFLDIDNIGNYFTYNPSIQWIDDNKTKLAVISRISGHAMIHRLKNCLHIQDLKKQNRNIIQVSGFSDYINIFDQNKIYNKY